MIFFHIAKSWVFHVFSSFTEIDQGAEIWNLVGGGCRGGWVGEEGGVREKGKKKKKKEYENWVKKSLLVSKLR